MPRDESFRTLHVPIRDSAHDLRNAVHGKVNPHDRTSLGDMDVGRRMIEGVDPDLEPLLPNQRGDRNPIIPKALGYVKRSLLTDSGTARPEEAPGPTMMTATVRSWQHRRIGLEAAIEKTKAI